jgi:hypothetical protein
MNKLKVVGIIIVCTLALTLILHLVLKSTSNFYNEFLDQSAFKALCNDIIPDNIIELQLGNSSNSPTHMIKNKKTFSVFINYEYQKSKWNNTVNDKEYIYRVAVKLKDVPGEVVFAINSNDSASIFYKHRWFYVKINGLSEILKNEFSK